MRYLNAIVSHLYVNEKLKVQGSSLMYKMTGDIQCHTHTHNLSYKTRRGRLEIRILLYNLLIDFLPNRHYAPSAHVNYFHNWTADISNI